MYRNRARAAHQLNTGSVEPVGAAQPQGYPTQSQGYPTQPQGSGNPLGYPPPDAGMNGQQDSAPVPFFNPSSYQNGHFDNPYSQEVANKGEGFLILRAYTHLAETQDCAGMIHFSHLSPQISALFLQIDE